MTHGQHGRERGSGWAWYLLLLIPFIATLFPGLYNSVSPALAGLPYLYWYQLLWVLISGLLTFVVYVATR